MKITHTLLVLIVLVVSSLQPQSVRAQAAPAETAAEDPADWPQFGHDPQRSNASPTQVDPPYCFAWKWYEAPLASRAQPVVSGGKLFIGSMEGTLFARDASSGSPLWRFESGSPIRHSAAVYNNSTVIFSTQAGFTYGLSFATGAQLWKLQTGASSTAPLVDPTAAIVYLASAEGTISAVRISNGSQLWKSPNLGAPILTTPALSADSTILYTGTEAIKAVALHASDGSLLWQTVLQGQSLADRAPLVVGGKVYYRSQPLINFHTLLHEGDAEMDKAGSWSTSWDPAIWAADWANVKTKILAYLNAAPTKQTFFSLDAVSGASTGTAPVLYTFGNNDIPSQAVAKGSEIFLPYRARHGIQTDSGTVHVTTTYDAELGRLNPATLDISGLTASTKVGVNVYNQFRMTSDEPGVVTMGGNILWVDNWERLGGVNVSSGTLVSGPAVSNDWPECFTQCGPGSTLNFFPLSGSGAAYPFPYPRISEGHQRSGAVIANNMVYWKVIEGGLGAISHQSGACGTPQVWGPVSPPSRPSAPASSSRALADYLDLDLTVPAANPDPAILSRLRAEVDTLAGGSGHWMPFYLERGFTQITVWPYNTTKAYPERPPKISVPSDVLTGNVYFHDPGDLLLSAAMAYPYLDSAGQAKLKTYMSGEMGRFPPLQAVPYGGTGTQDWLKTGLVRESYQNPLRTQLNNWPPVGVSLNTLYALWLWSKNTGDWSYAQTKWSNAKSLMDQLTPLNHSVGKMDYFSDLSGVIGYYRLALHFGNTTEAARAKTTALAFMNDVIANPQAYFTRADNEYLDPRDIASGWYAPALFGLTPEVGMFLREQTGGKAADYLISKEYGSNGNGLRWWYLTRGGAYAEVGETSYTAPNAAWSHFMAHAYLLGDTHEILSGYLDRPWGKADLFSIQKEAAALQTGPAQPNFSSSSLSTIQPVVQSGMEVTFTLNILNSGIATSGPLSVTINLPSGLSYTSGSLQAAPSIGSTGANGNILTWLGDAPAGHTLALTYRARVSLPSTSHKTLTQTAVLAAAGISNLTLRLDLMANPYQTFTPFITR